MKRPPLTESQVRYTYLDGPDRQGQYGIMVEWMGVRIWDDTGKACDQYVGPKGQCFLVKPHRIKVMQDADRANGKEVIEVDARARNR